jgi:hypothetical protein
MAGDEAKYVADAPTIRKGSGTFLSLTDSVGPALSYFAANFPAQLARALGKVGSVVRAKARQSMEDGGPSGVSWAQTVDWKPRGRRGRLARKRRKSAGVSPLAGALHDKLFDGRGKPNRPYGKMYGAARYILDNQNLKVTTGWVTGTAAAFGKDVQAGLRGANPFNAQFEGEQPVTRSMRRALAAAGLVLARGTVFLRQPGRPMWRPIYEQMSPEVQAIVTAQMSKYFSGGPGYQS